ncbi:hypothetical protein WJX74_001699 [Apatococcus lobatus]|uniref:Guanylate cyclase domain-containing protein n=1 Tax=Apatococcus lobatus TaxID=904363 RepID=A0AAW1RY44_9CHLO
MTSSTSRTKLCPGWQQFQIFKDVVNLTEQFFRWTQSTSRGACSTVEQKVCHLSPVGGFDAVSPDFQHSVILARRGARGPLMQATQTPSMAPSLAAGNQGSTCDQFLNVRPKPEADLPEQRDALMKLWAATNGEHWLSSPSGFYSSGPGDIGLFDLLADTLQIIAADAQAQAESGGGCSLGQVASTFRLAAYNRPWGTPNTSYCDWIGIGCCFGGGGLTAQFCAAGAQSVVFVSLTGQGLRGSLPDVFAAFPDLQYIAVNHNPYLVGKVPDFPAGLASKLQFVQMTNTGLNQCEDLPYGDIGECLPNWLKVAKTTNAKTAVAGHDALLCPLLDFWRPIASLPVFIQLAAAFNPAEFYAYIQHAARSAAAALQQEDLSNANFLLQNVISIDPSFYGYRGCSCLQNYHGSLTTPASGVYNFECLADDISQSLTLPIALPAALVGGSLLILGVIFALFYKDLFREIELRRNIRMKTRCKPGLLTKDQYKILGLPADELTLCMTDIAGSTALWEVEAQVMDQALSLQEECLRSLLPQHCGHEVYTEGDAFVISFHDPLDGIQFVSALQLELLKLPWPKKLLEQAQATEIRNSGGDELLFAGLRLRAVLHTGWPTTIETHQTTGHISYSGMAVELTEALSNLPSGGQCIMSGLTYQRAFPQMQALADASAQQAKGKGGSSGNISMTSSIKARWQRKYQPRLPGGIIAMKTWWSHGCFSTDTSASAQEHSTRKIGTRGVVDPSSPSAMPLNIQQLHVVVSDSAETDVEGSNMPVNSGLLVPDRSLSVASHQHHHDIRSASSEKEQSKLHHPILKLLGPRQRRPCCFCSLLTFQIRSMPDKMSQLFSVAHATARAQSQHSFSLLAKIGIATGQMIKICPHKSSGRADYFGQAVNRASRLKDAASPGQVIVLSPPRTSTGLRANCKAMLLSSKQSSAPRDYQICHKTAHQHCKGEAR